MSHEPTGEDLARWRQLLEAEKAATAARMALFTSRGSLVELVRHGLQEPGERAVALDVASRLETEEVQELLPDLLALASFGHGLTERCRELILRLSRPWLLSHVEQYAEPILASGGDEEYRALLGLYTRIDPTLALKLAHRAAQSPDAAIKEAGEESLLTLHGSPIRTS
jgi:hypothetical protein